MVPTCLYYSCITLTKGTWQYASIYSVMRANARCQARDEENEDCDNDHDEDGDAIMSDPCNDTEVISYRRLYLLLDEASLTFNADPERGKHCASLCCSLLNVKKCNILKQHRIIRRIHGWLGAEIFVFTLKPEVQVQRPGQTNRSTDGRTKLLALLARDNVAKVSFTKFFLLIPLVRY